VGVLAKNKLDLHVSKSWHLLAEFHNSTDLDIWTHCYDEWINRNNALHGHNQQTKIKARTTRAQYKIRALYSLRHHCFTWPVDSVSMSAEAHFTRQADPRHLENWIALNEARILSQVTHHHKHTRTGQRSIEEYFLPIT
jgi:hypothetical protein